MLSDGSYGTIDSIGIEALLKPEVTYNFEVADYHTYYVGERNVLVHNKCLQEHHYLTNKSKEFTPKIKKITDNYGLNLDGSWNKEVLPHIGRHAKKYHQFMIEQIKRIDSVAKGNVKVFLQEFETVKAIVRAKPEMMYKAFWANGGFV